MDSRSKLTTAKVEDLERFYKSLERKLFRLRAMLDEMDAAGETKVKMQYWQSGVDAERKLEVFVRGLEASK